MVFLGIKRFRDPYYQGFAAQISFYLLLSIVPVLLILTQILGYFNMSVEDVVQWLSAYTGNEISSALHRLIEFSPAGAGNIVFLVVALWAASRAQFAIMRITNYTFTDGQTTGRGYWRERFRAVRTMIVTLFLQFAFCPGDSGFTEIFLLRAVVRFAESGRGLNISTISGCICAGFLGLALYFSDGKLQLLYFCPQTGFRSAKSCPAAFSRQAVC